MARCVLLFIIYLFAFKAIGEIVPNNFVVAIHQVETQGRFGAIHGANGELGPLQVTKRCWKDSHVSGHFSQCSDYNFSIKIMNLYLNRYCADAIKHNDFETMARIWNGGPNGIHVRATISYWKKIRKELDESLINN